MHDLLKISTHPIVIKATKKNQEHQVLGSVLETISTHVLPTDWKLHNYFNQHL